MSADLVARLSEIEDLRTHGYAARAARLSSGLAREHGADRRLAVYGSLAPGEENERELAGLDGVWRAGTVRGRLFDRGWGARLGFPAFVWDPDGDEVEVALFESPDLPRHWARLDAFEGPGYDRILVPVRRGEATLLAWLYALARGG